jgi:hypothetical protein
MEMAGAADRSFGRPRHSAITDWAGSTYEPQTALARTPDTSFSRWVEAFIYVPHITLLRIPDNSLLGLFRFPTYAPPHDAAANTGQFILGAVLVVHYAPHMMLFWMPDSSFLGLFGFSIYVPHMMALRIPDSSLLLFISPPWSCAGCLYPPQTALFRIVEMEFSSRIVFPPFGMFHLRWKRGLSVNAHITARRSSLPCKTHA